VEDNALFVIEKRCQSGNQRWIFVEIGRQLEVDKLFPDTTVTRQKKVEMARIFAANCPCTEVKEMLAQLTCHAI